MIFPKENKSFFGGPDHGGLIVDTRERKTLGFPLEICTFLEIDEGWLEGLGTNNIEFLKEKKNLGGSRSWRMDGSYRGKETIGFPLEKCTFLETDEGLLEGLGTQNIDFSKGK